MELRTALESTDVGEINAKTEALNEASRTLADVLYAQASAQAQSQAAGSGGDGAEAAEEEVIEDADYEVVDDDEKATRS
jgi:molecular chaperone DnaK